MKELQQKGNPQLKQNLYYINAKKIDKFITNYYCISLSKSKPVQLVVQLMSYSGTSLHFIKQKKNQINLSNFIPFNVFSLFNSFNMNMSPNYLFQHHNNFIKMISKIRKQPKRKTKKATEKTLKNPFLNNTPTFLPQSISQTLSPQERISIMSVYSLNIQKPSSIDINLSHMRQAIIDQQMKMGQLIKNNGQQLKININKGFECQNHNLEEWGQEGKQLGLAIDLGDHWNILHQDAQFFH